MENTAIVILIVSTSAYLLECTNIEGKTLEPIYWNSSNPLFKTPPDDNCRQINAAINDKLDIICPRYGKGNKEELFYFKLYLVSEKNFQKCNSTGGRRLLTCNIPNKEKKYTFYFQQLSPSPWGLEFQPGKAYYVISTSDGTRNGIDSKKGGVCTRFSMKLQLEIHPPENLPPDIDYYPMENLPGWSENNANSHNKTDYMQDTQTGIHTLDDDDSRDPSEPGEKVSGNGLIIGAVLGACAVLFIVLLAFLGYKVFTNRQRHKKYPSPSISPTQASSPLQQVTLLPISPPNRHSHHSCHGRLYSDRERQLSTTVSSHGDPRPPPSYNETLLANGGTMVEV